jgi:hypothetical protein
MFNVITNFFASSEDKDPTFIRVTRSIMILALAGTLLTIAIVMTTADSQARMATVSALAGAGLLEFVALLLILRSHHGQSSDSSCLVFTITIVSLNANSIHDISIVAYPFIIMATFLRRRLLVTYFPDSDSNCTFRNPGYNWFE